MLQDVLNLVIKILLFLIYIQIIRSLRGDALQNIKMVIMGDWTID